MAKITHLPDEVIAIILENESINWKDITNFQSTCKRFHQITLPNSFWERKYYQSFICSTAEKKYSKEKQKENFHHVNFKQILYYIVKIQNYAFKMSKSDKKLRNIHKKQLEHFLCPIVENSMTYYFIWDKMNRISSQKSCKLFPNLTCEYYFNLIFYCLKQFRFTHEQMKFMMMPTTKLILEKQLTIMAKCFQPRVSYSLIDTWLDNITQTVLSRMKNKYPRHSICSTALEQFSFWRDNNIETFWNETESIQIICVLREYIYFELEFHELHEILMTLDFEAEYVEYIIEHFREFLLTTTYHIVARRLGIYSTLSTEGITIEVQWALRNENNQRCLYVNSNPLLSSSDVLSFINCPINLYTQIIKLPCFKVTKAIIKYFYNKVKFDHKIQFNWNFKMFIILREFSNIDQQITSFNYSNITRIIEDKSNTVKKSLNKRTEDVKFAVGMIVAHEHHPDDRDGVIIGWHRKCDKQYLNKIYGSNIFIRCCSETNYVCAEVQGDIGYCTYNKLHYIILTENKSKCYVQQEGLLLRPPKEIDNIEIGKYFSSFEGTHYVPNESLRNRYPEDTAAILLAHELARR